MKKLEDNLKALEMKIKDYIYENLNYYENVYEIIQIYLTLPCSNAITERIISAMNFIHNKLRNALKEKHVD